RSPYDADLMMAGFAEGARWAAERAAALREPEWEYGWRSFFDDGEEYEWLTCSSRADAEKQIKAAEAVEDRVGSDGDDHLTYSLWRREVREPGPWQPVPADETGGSGRDRL
ncbi:hypothetical protein ABE10_01795, partial [Bacillus toyonensis]|nr:hypothetical protein [Bacillus toyonensis]